MFGEDFKEEWFVYILHMSDHEDKIKEVPPPTQSLELNYTIILLIKLKRQFANHMVVSNYPPNLNSALAQPQVWFPRHPSPIQMISQILGKPAEEKCEY